MIAEVVPAALAGERLDRIVSFVADISRSHAAATIAAGGVRVDGVAAPSGKVRLVEGQQVEVDESTIPRVQLPVADPTVEFAVIYEDATVIVVDKPAALVVHPGAGNMEGTLVHGLLARYPDINDVGDPTRPGIVHRLDAGSSGLLVVARTQEAADHLVAQFASRDANDRAGRRYLALVWGHPAAAHGIIDAPIGRDRRDPLRMAVVADGRPARTEYWLVERFSAPAEVARVDCRLETGRTHQIRVHLESIGHPLVGDSTYGQRRPMLGLERPFLHAAELAFDHPATGERVEFRSELPADLATMLAALSPSP
jgi:23S rRNA pseudouridine1911/1915/1917 synthase